MKSYKNHGNKLYNKKIIKLNIMKTNNKMKKSK